MKFDFKTILILILLAGIALFIFFWPKSEPSKVITIANDSIETINQENRILRMSQRTLELSLQGAKLKAKADSGRFKREISTLNKRLSIKRTRIDTLILENPNLASYMQTADSVFSMMHGRVDSLERDLAFRDSLYSDLVYIKNKELNNMHLIVSQKDFVIEDLEKQVRKKRRGTKLLKVAAVVGTVGGLLLGSSL